jgi:hypothetical protein
VELSLEITARKYAWQLVAKEKGKVVVF